MSALRPIEVDSDNEVRELNGNFEEIDLTGDATPAPTPDPTDNVLDDGEDESDDEELPAYRLSMRYPWVEVDSITRRGLTIRVNDNVELEKSRAKEFDSESHSGDFLRVKHIYRNLETNKVQLRGYCLRRTKYFSQTFDWKLNELVLLFEVHESARHSYKTKGMMQVPLRKVIRLRDIVITDRPWPSYNYEEMGFRPSSRSGTGDWDGFKTKQDLRNYIFHNGPLVCRWLYVKVFRPVGKEHKSYEGEVRTVFQSESDHHRQRIVAKGNDPQNPITLDMSTNRSDSGPQTPRKRRDRSPSVEEVTPNGIPKQRQFTYGDVFCGAGGASRGATDAGLEVLFGLDMDPLAMQAYHLNFPRAKAIMRSSHDAEDFFKKPENRKFIGMDILHLSPPCCFFSPAHTHAGKNDQSNLEALYTVAPLLKLLQPRAATLEQTTGLLDRKKHSLFFRALLNQIIVAGYNVRYKIVNMSEHGLAQTRKRLLLIAAKRGLPLPDFPAPSHGPASGHRRFNYIWDALEPLRLRGNNHYDPYHNPDEKERRQRLNETPYDPKTSFLRGIVTGKGSESYHYEGKRQHTVRESALFQSFPIDHKFTGPHQKAMLQVGNAYPPLMAKKVFQQCIWTLRAYDEGLIGVDSDLSKVKDFFEADGSPKEIYRKEDERSPKKRMRQLDGNSPVLGRRQSGLGIGSSSNAASSPRTPLRQLDGDSPVLGRRQSGLGVGSSSNAASSTRAPLRELDVDSPVLGRRQSGFGIGSSSNATSSTRAPNTATRTDSQPSRLTNPFAAPGMRRLEKFLKTPTPESSRSSSRTLSPGSNSPSPSTADGLKNGPRVVIEID